MKNKIKSVLAALGLFGATTAQAQEVGNPLFGTLLDTLLSHMVPEADVTAARQLQGAYYLDAREWEEFQVSHIPEARWVGYKSFDLTRLEGIPKDQPIVVYCSVGYRSERIARRLEQEGYSRVYNLYGGIFEWVNQGNSVQDASGTTTRTHAYSAAWSVWLQAGEKVY